LWAAACAAVVCAGCTTTGRLAAVAPQLEAAGPPVAMAVIAEPGAADQGGQRVEGLIVQVLLTDMDGRLTRSQGSLAFSVYRDDTGTPVSVEADRRWKFSTEETARSQTAAPKGVVHNFWLPLNGKLAGARKLQLYTVYTAESGLQLSQKNQIVIAPKSMQIEQRTDLEELKKRAAARSGNPAGDAPAPQAEPRS
jgi:muconolactone delta-isomerase